MLKSIKHIYLPPEIGKIKHSLLIFVQLSRKIYPQKSQETEIKLTYWFSTNKRQFI